MRDLRIRYQLVGLAAAMTVASQAGAANKEPEIPKCEKRYGALAVHELEQLLEKAKSGELRAFGCAMVLNGTYQGSATGFTSAGQGPHTATLVMAMERGKIRMMGFVEDIDIGMSLGGY